MKADAKIRTKPVPEEKKRQVATICDMMKAHPTILVASTKGLPASQFQKIKKNLRGKADVVMAKKSILNRAIADSGVGQLQNLKEQIVADVVLMISDIDPFELSGILLDSQTPTKAKAGDIAPEDITVEPGPTDLIPGPAISELGSVGLKVAVEDGKLAIKQPATIVKEGEEINDKVASVMGKLNILPMKVGFIPLAAYDGKSDKVYVGIKIDKEGALADLRTAIGKALGFAVHVGYFTQQTVKYFIAKAGLQEKAIEAKLGSGAPAEEAKEESPEEKPVEEASAETKEESDSNNDKGGSQ